MYFEQFNLFLYFNMVPFWYRSRCWQVFLTSVFGSDCAQHIWSFSRSALRAYGFRYSLLLQEGGVYLDIKIGMVDHLSDLLQTVSVVISRNLAPLVICFF